MHPVFACLDGHADTPALIDWAVWSARRLAAPLELLHALERSPDRAAGAGDYTGAIGLGAQEALLQQLSARDEAQGQRAQAAGRQLLAAGQAQALAAGLPACGIRLRHGTLVDAALVVEPDARLFVLGQHHHDAQPTRRHLDHHLEALIRTVQRPVLVCTGRVFAAPTHCVIAYDGSPTANRAVERVAQSPLLHGLTVELLMVGQDTTAHRQALAQAESQLRSAGFQVHTALVPGEPAQQIPAYIQTVSASLLVIGAYGHSRVREWLVGSTTTALLRVSDVPVLVLR